MAATAYIFEVVESNGKLFSLKYQDNRESFVSSK